MLRLHMRADKKHVQESEQCCSDCARGPKEGTYKNLNYRAEKGKYKNLKFRTMFRSHMRGEEGHVQESEQCLDCT